MQGHPSGAVSCAVQIGLLSLLFHDFFPFHNLSAACQLSMHLSGTVPTCEQSQPVTNNQTCQSAFVQLRNWYDGMA